MAVAALVWDFASVTVALAQPARSDSAWTLDSRVIQIVSGGTWSDGDSSGHYRIIVRSDGTDHVHFTTMVQWMRRREMQQDLELVRSMDLAAVGTRWYSMLGPEIRSSRGRWILTVDAADGPLRAAKYRPQFVLGPPGRITAR